MALFRSIALILSMLWFTGTASALDQDTETYIQEQVDARLQSYIASEAFQAKINEGIIRFIQAQNALQEQAAQQAEQSGTMQLMPIDPSRDHIRGNPNAAFTLLEYSDFECPFCKRFHETAKAFLSKNDEQITKYSNLSAYLNYFLDDINWVGFYLRKDSELILGPFQGLPACTKIAMGNGVVGFAASTMKTQIVDDVDAFEGHIACDSNSKSEIAVPIIRHHRVIGVLDIDSPIEKRFDSTDRLYLEKVIDKLVDIL